MEAIDFSNLPTNADKSTLSSDADTSTAEPTEVDYALQLQYVEMGLEQHQLLQFTENRDKDFWYGAYEDLALFNFWKSIKDKSEGLMFSSRLEQHNIVTYNFTLAEPTEPVPLSSGCSIVVEG